MTPTEPGRALDALVAEKVMGLIVERRMQPPRHAHAHGEPQTAEWYAAVPNLAVAGDPFFLLPRYSSDIAAAWQVVDKLAASGKMACLTIDLLGGEGEEWRVFFQWVDVSDDELAMPYADAPTAPLAICLAALRAVGHE